MCEHQPGNNSYCYNVAWKQNSYLPSQFSFLRAGPVLYGWTKQWWGRKGIPASFFLSLLANSPLAVSAFSGLSLIAPFLLLGPGVLLISGFSALTTWCQKPRGPGALLSLMYKLIFASEPHQQVPCYYLHAQNLKEGERLREDPEEDDFFRSTCIYTDVH